MVNVGGPSKGCLTCIQRKIRCDRQRPICGQCIKSSRRCGGYRNATDIMFRDQSQMVVAKANAESQGEPDMIRSPRLNAEGGLVTFFTNNFTCGSSGSSAGTNLFWVPTRFDDLLKADSASLSVQSAGAMALARLRKSPEYYREAQKKYGQALLSLAKLWQEQDDIDKDTVLITIMFLSFFEILASYESTSRQSWITHLEGLGLLLKRRSEEFIQTPFGTRMLLQSRSQAIINALQTKTPLPPTFQRPSNGVPPMMPPQFIPPFVADMLFARLATLQAQCQLLGLESGPSDTLLVAELTALDGDLCQWAENLPSSWSFSTQPSTRTSEFWWETRCDVYTTAVRAHTWNMIRVARIVVYDLIQEIALRSLVPGADSGNFVPGLACEVTPAPEVRRMVTDICATVPTYYRPSSATVGSGTIGNRPLLGTTYWLLWPLEVIGSMREAPMELRRWIIQCLQRIYDTTGIVKAQVAIDRLKTRYVEIVVA